LKENNYQPRLLYTEKQALVDDACNLRYLGGRDEEDHSSKPAQENSLQDLILKKNPSPKRTGGVAQGVDPEYKPQYLKKKLKEKARHQ
jgi:hypothetical protein